MIKSTFLLGIIEPDGAKKKRFNFDSLFPKNLQPYILLKKIALFFGPVEQENKGLIGIEALFINYLTGKKSNSIYYGNPHYEKENIEMKDIMVEQNDYFCECILDFDKYINYIKIKTVKGKEIEFGKKTNTEKSFLIHGNDNMIQFFWGDTFDKGIKSLGYKYISQKNFSFYRKFSILKLKYRLEHDEKFKADNVSKKNENVDKDISMKYLLKACLMPNTIFSSIIKYC